MADQRETILNRLVAVCGAVPGINAAGRNMLAVAGLARPAVVIQDGAETLLDAPQGMRTSRAQRMELSPLIVIMLRGDDGAEGGALLTLFRSRIVAAVLTDAALLDAVVDGGIRYEGVSVEAPGAEAREYRAELNIVFTTMFRLSDFAGV